MIFGASASYLGQINNIRGNKREILIVVFGRSDRIDFQIATDIFKTNNVQILDLMARNP